MKRLSVVLLMLLVVGATAELAVGAGAFQWPEKLEKRVRALERKITRKGDDRLGLREGAFAITAPKASRRLVAEVSLYLQLLEEDFLELFGVNKKVGSVPEVSITYGVSDSAVFHYSLSQYYISGINQTQIQVTKELRIRVRGGDGELFTDSTARALQPEVTRALVCYSLGNNAGDEAQWFERSVLAFFATWDVRDEVDAGILARRKRAVMPAAFVESVAAQPPLLSDLIEARAGFDRNRLEVTFADMLLTHKKASGARKDLVETIGKALSTSKGVELSKGQTQKLERLWLQHIQETLAVAAEGADEEH